MSATETESSIERRTRRWFERFVELSYRGLPRLLVDDGRNFCFRALDEGDGRIRLERESYTYATMCLIGLGRQKKLGRDYGIDIAPVVDTVVEWNLSKSGVVGYCGLVLWALSILEDDRIHEIAKSALTRVEETRQADFPSMEMGYLLIGLSEAMRVGVEGLEEFAAHVAERLRANQGDKSGVMSFSSKMRRKNIHRARLDSRLGSFASQVYPTIGFSAHYRATGDERSLAASRACANAIRDLQGPEGQWWWVFNKVKRVPALRYPVYSVHQDAMGAMALLSAAIADGGHDRFDAAVLKSFTWFDDRPECSDKPLIDDEGGMVWRAVQHDEPSITKRMGLSDKEIARMGRAAWTGRPDTRPLENGYVCPECRPYQLGWALLAAALHTELKS